MSLRVICGCESSGVVREAFRKLGHNAWSCDLLPADDNSEYHFQCDIRDIIGRNWDLAVLHPPCTHLCVSGARWFKNKKVEQEEALEFVRYLMNVPIPHTCIENPVGILSTRICKPTQYIQPYEYGCGETKKTGLWLKNLTPLVPTDIVEGRSNRIHMMPPGPTRWKERSRTYPGIAKAMAEQFSHYILNQRKTP